MGDLSRDSIYTHAEALYKQLIARKVNFQIFKLLGSLIIEFDCISIQVINLFHFTYNWVLCLYRFMILCSKFIPDKVSVFLYSFFLFTDNLWSKMIMLMWVFNLTVKDWIFIAWLNFLLFDHDDWKLFKDQWMHSYIHIIRLEYFYRSQINHMAWYFHLSNW